MLFSDENNHTLVNSKADTRVNGKDISKYLQDNSVPEKDVTVESDDDDFAKVSDTQQEMQPEHTTKQNQQSESSTLYSTTGDYIDHPDSLYQEVKSIRVQSSNKASKKESQVRVPTAHQAIRYRPIGSSEWRNATVVSCAGKATGKYQYYFNILDEHESQPREVNWEKDVRSDHGKLKQVR